MRILISSIFVFALLTAYAIDEKIVKSTIKEVTVYAQGAQIQRKASYSVSSGVTEIVLDGISNQIDPKSIQVNATGDIIILDSKYSVYYPEPNKSWTTNEIPLSIKRKIWALEDSIFNIGFSLTDLQDEIDVLNASKNILKNNGAIKGQGKVNDSIPLLKEAMAYYELKMKELNKKILSLSKSKQIMDRNIRGMQRRLTDLKNYQQNNGNQTPEQVGPSYRITVTVTSKVSTSGRMEVSYLVNNAGWEALYDLKSEATSSKLNLRYKANVYQNTGIDWEDVRLNISTNNPYQNKTKPELHPWYLENYANYNRQLEEKKRATLATTGNIQNIEVANDMEVMYAAPANATNFNYAKTSVNYTQVIEHMISAEFKIDLPYSIKSNNQKHMVLVKSEDVDVEYKYYTVPKIDNSVYLVANISNLDDLQLVPAKANIFFDGSYVGETFLNPGVMQDTLSLSLGKDPNILVKRTFMKKNYKEKVIGSDVEKTSSYEIEIKNNKSKSIAVIVQDQVPITRNQDIVIRVEDIGKGKVSKKTGIIEWEIKLKSKESEILPLEYTVKHGKDVSLTIPK
ncbi:MAG: DUF4139 domain-containing protein [Lishizhenia sp.]